MKVEEAINKVLEMGKDGMEHVIVLGPDGEVKTIKDGIKNQVDLHDEIVSGDVFFKGGKIVHNHPLPVSLSMNDLMMAAHTGCEIWAACEEGSRYWSQGFTMSNDLALMLIKLEADDFKQQAGTVMVDNGWTHDEMNAIGEHFQNLYFKSQGYLVSYEFKLSKAHAALAARFHRDLVKADSHLKDVYHV